MILLFIQAQWNPARLDVIEGTFQQLAHGAYSCNTFEKQLTSHAPRAKGATRALPQPCQQLGSAAWDKQAHTRPLSPAHLFQSGESSHFNDQNKSLVISPQWNVSNFSICHHKADAVKLDSFFTQRDANAPGTCSSSKSLQHHQGLSTMNQLDKQHYKPKMGSLNLHERSNRSVLFPLSFHTALDLLRSRWVACRCLSETCF